MRRILPIPEEIPMPLRPEFENPRFKEGLATRREVLGPDYVDKSVAAADDFTAPFQKLLTEWCWGDTWNRPGLDRKTRSMLNLAMLTALNRPHEIKLHVRGALNNGLTLEQIREVLLHTMVYCGVPATLDAFKAAKEVIDQAAAEKKG
jgi:4-carboxymuconolactone decarboxylase